MADSPRNLEDERNPGARHATELLDREKLANPVQDQRDAFEKEFGGDNYDQDAPTSGSEILAQREAEPMNYTGTGATKKKRSVAMRLKGLFTKKRSAVATVLGITGIGGIGLLSVFSPAGMLVNLMDGFTMENDAVSAAFEQRDIKALLNLTRADEPDPICTSATKNIKCKMGRISNKALNQLEAKGVKPIGVDGRKKTGYPDINPSGYEFDFGDGNKITVGSDRIGEFLGQPENRRMASKVLGVGGAFNLRQKAYIGKHMTKFYSKIPGLSRKGGLADGQNGKLSANERLTEAMKKLQSRIPGNEKISTVAENVKTKVKDRMDGAKRGGTAYVAAVGGCVATKVPSYFAAGTAAIQLGQTLPIIMDVVLSPGSKAKASAFGSGFSSEDMDTIGSLLTHTVNGKSALDSQYLQAAIGTNKSKPKVSEKFTPGYSVLTNPVVLAANDVDKSTEPACNAIMSPTAMYTAMAADMALTVAASATIIGGVAKIAASIVISEAAIAVATNVAEGVAKDVLIDLAENDDIPNAQGEELGDVLGISATAFFSSSAMARHLPALTESQVVAFNDMRRENEQLQREMDIASLSPFDTSSRYTFLGSIVSSMRTTATLNGGYANPLAGLASMAKLPLAMVSPTAGAARFNDSNCTYASQFRLGADGETDSPAINMAGLPCAGLTRAQATMSTSEAIDLMISNGWIDNSQTIQETATIDELQGNVIVSGTPLDDFINTCADMTTGEYLLDAEGCTVKPADGDLSLPAGIEIEPEDAEPRTAGTADSRSLEAMSVFLIDFQIGQMINGSDDEEGAVSVAATPTGKYSSPVGANHGMSDGFGPRSCSGCSSWHVGLDLLNSADTNVYAFGDGVVESADITGGNNIVRIKHADGLVSVYFHMWAEDILVKTGDTVTSGQQIGKIGNSGDSYGAHLHFELDISAVNDPAVYAGYPKNTAGFAPPGHRIDPAPFMKDQGLAGY